MDQRLDRAVIVNEPADVSAEGGVARRLQAPSQAIVETDLAAFTAHEVRNPLAALRAMAQLTLTTPDSEVRRTMMQQIVDDIDELDGFLQQVLFLVSAGSAKMEYVDIEAVLRNVVQLFAVHADAVGADVHIRMPSSVPLLWGNPELLRHVFMNLLKNALEAMPDGGRVDVVLRRLERRQSVRVSIRDSGPGIPESLRERLLMDLPATSRSAGGGFGLPFVRRIVSDIHDGRIWFRTKTDVGTVFCVELPAVSLPLGAPDIALRA